MCSYSFIHDASFEQLLRWWHHSDPLPEDFLEGDIDEVACALAKHPPEGVALLKRFLESGDLEQRCGALNCLASPELADEEVRAALVRAFYSPERALQIAALWGFIHMGYFPLPRAALSPWLNGEDERMAALAMVYLSHACPEESVRILRAALRSPNPRMREYACDEIGDRDIDELKDEMRLLLADADPNVAQAAAANG